MLYVTILFADVPQCYTAVVIYTSYKTTLTHHKVLEIAKGMKEADKNPKAFFKMPDPVVKKLEKHLQKFSNP